MPRSRKSGTAGNDGSAKRPTRAHGGGSGHDTQAVVVGAGPAGLSVAAMLDRHGVDALVLDREQEPGTSWARRYDSLRLNTPRLLSYLPRYPLPRRYGRWPSRDQMVEYLHEYTRRFDLSVRPGTEVDRFERIGSGWRLRTSAGDIDARFAVVATGHDHDPHVPDWPGREGFHGELLHSASYREPSPFRGRDVLVVAARTSGSEIAAELARSGAHRVRVAVRMPPNVVPRQWLGVPLMYVALPVDPLPDWAGDTATRIVQRIIYGDLGPYGLARSPYGAQTDARRRHASTLIDAGFVELLKRGEIELVAGVESLDSSKVVLSDGSRIAPDAVIAATGYRTTLPKLVGHLDVLDDRGHPRIKRDGESPRAPGLYFNGYQFSIIGQLVHIRRGSRRIARAIAARLRDRPAEET